MRWEKKEEETNKLELDPKDNRSIYLNGVRVTHVEAMSIGKRGVTITIQAEVGVRESQ